MLTTWGGRPPAALRIRERRDAAVVIAAGLPIAALAVMVNNRLGFGAAVAVAMAPITLYLTLGTRSTWFIVAAGALFLLGSAYPIFSVHLGPVPITNADVSLYVLVAASLLRVRTHHSQQLPIWFYAFSALAAVHVFASITDGLQGGEWADARPLLGLLTVFAALRFPRGPQLDATVPPLTTLMVASLSAGVVLLAVSAATAGRLETPLGLVSPGLVRLSAEPFLLLVAPLFLTLRRQHGWHLGLWVLCLLLVLSQTLTIAAAAVLTWLVGATLYRGPESARRGGPAAILGVAAIALIVLIFGQGGSLGRFDPARVQSDSAQYRNLEFEAVVTSADSPREIFFGRGMGSIITIGSSNTAATGYSPISKTDTHNFFSNIYMKTGLIGLALVALWLRRLLVRLRLHGPVGRSLGLGLVWLIFSSLSAPFLWTLQGWAILGLLTGWAYRPTSSPQRSPSVPATSSRTPLSEPNR